MASGAGGAGRGRSNGASAMACAAARSQYSPYGVRSGVAGAGVAVGATMASGATPMMAAMNCSTCADANSETSAKLLVATLTPACSQTYSVALPQPSQPAT